MTEDPREQSSPSPEAIHHGLARIRIRRRFFFGVILIYVPALLVVLRMAQSGRTTLTLFGLWVALLVVAVALAAVVRCPRCGEYYHTNGPTFLPVRKCVHCGLPVNGDQHRNPGPVHRDTT